MEILFLFIVHKLKGLYFGDSHLFQTKIVYVSVFGVLENNKDYE